MASSLSKAGVWNKLITQVNLGIFLSNNISIIYGLTTEMFWIYINLLHHSHFTLTVVAANFMPEVTLRRTPIQRGANTFLASRFMLQKLDKLWLYGPLARHNISLFVLNLLLWFGPWYQLAKQRLIFSSVFTSIPGKSRSTSPSSSAICKQKDLTSFWKKVARTAAIFRLSLSLLFPEDCQV